MRYVVQDDSTKRYYKQAAPSEDLSTLHDVWVDDVGQAFKFMDRKSADLVAGLITNHRAHNNLLDTPDLSVQEVDA
jgi:hypothetical protein